MFSLDLTLNSFVSPIAICQSETDIGNIFHIFKRTNCDTLAIPSGINNWGIVRPQKLLAFLAKSRQWHAVEMGGYPKNLTDKENRTATIQDFNCLIEPATVYQADTLVVDFLHHLDDSLHFTQDVYLIADRSGQLKGKLDLSGLLRYIGTKFNQSKVDLSSLRLQDPLINLIDAIALPFKIETSTGKDIYFNQCWQELIPSSNNKYANQPQSNVSIANWWIEQQLAQSQSDSSSNLRTNHPRQDCCLGDRYYLENRPNILSLEMVFDNLNHKSETQTNPLEVAVSCPINNTNLNSPVSFEDIQLEEKKWHYLRVPITPSQLQSQSTTTAYWLVLAIDRKHCLPYLAADSELSSPDLPRQGTSNLLMQFQERETTDCSLSDSLAILEILLPTIAHELKSPLTGIVGLSSLLKAQKLGSLNQRQIRYTQLIHNSGQRLMSVVNGLLELTSLTTGKIELKLELINLESWCAQLYQEVSTKLKLIITEELEQPIPICRLQLNIEPKLKTAIADRARLSAIVSHLMWSVIQFSSSRQSQEVHVKIKRVDRHLAIVISNSAVEIPSILPSESKPDFIDSNIQLIIAKYLAIIIDAKIETAYLKDSCQFTLLLTNANPQSVSKLELKESLPISRDRRQPNLTILCLYPEPELVAPKLRDSSHVNFNLKHWVEQDWSNSHEDDCRHRIIEADGLEQAHTLARIWKLDAVVLDGYQIINCQQYLRSLQQSKYLSALPLIVLDTKTTEAANQIEELNVYPCLLPAEGRSIKDLIQVVQIATNRNFK